MTSTTRRHVRRRILPTRLLFYPGDDDRNDPDHAQDRHHSRRHHSSVSKNFGKKLRTNQKGKKKPRRKPNGAMFGQKKRTNKKNTPINEPGTEHGRQPCLY